MFDQIYFEEVIVKQAPASRSRRLSFSGAKNFRDLGGYSTVDGRTVRWEVLYRSDGLHKLTASDLRQVSALTLDRVIDFRAEHEVEREPDRLPVELAGREIKIPILDSSTRVWHDSRDEFMKNLKNIDAADYLIQTNIELATIFTPQMKQFVGELMSANGKPVLYHCAAGKDRTGFASAILLRMLGVPHDVVMRDYLLTNQYFLPQYTRSLNLVRFLKGKAFAYSIHAFMEARPEYLEAAFDSIHRQYGSFEDYVYKALDLTRHDTEHLRAIYLE